MAYFAFIAQDLDQSFSALSELLLYLAVRANAALDPGVLGDFEDAWSLCWIVGHHLVEEVFE